MKNTQLLNFTQLSKQELEMTHNWRNTKSVQKFMLNPLDISLKSHLDFVSSLNNRDDKLYFLVKYENNYIGVIDFTQIKGKGCMLGLYKNPQTHNVGDILLNIISEYAFDTLKLAIIGAEVFSDNTQAIMLYKRHSFQEKSRKNLETRELIYMELKNED
ncbi:UDP-4-amino-4,6-dideoxy-N-acetyl-beta-L-altrosamine N-acetyltransferase [Sulfurimonas sp.]|jgi:UDP-4-amino-4,6-dideoxy-N-acetyl-beta-L-altrosamine N-acetyltransferase|uniref:UDP-4-amino-4, 6-dideoxy-N-acetyl-beta-L-altrosamine N-acetyltransferase n=1 Tax=Sulfurimonas sp. TaxID=2022749 RepID=UPI0025F6ABB6|nr:UDP-4-amino-4,6-dideoxy-N-acetyl-beta-L-altrosamine N-acetyltransferase [Sulfurimonas sp.]MBT5935836.1 UDP-4-amino-4,6-dideoxy-N-acetyl-beta-L-altrosamine N-acetyltransferase [Sulfurimonas sp.]